MEYLSLGTIIDAFSLDGTLKVISTTTNGDKRYKKGNVVFVMTKDGQKQEHTVLAYRKSGQIDFVTLKEVTTKEDALALKGGEIQVIKSQDDLEEGFYYYSDLRGCKIVDESKVELGIVKEVEEFPAQITLRVKRNGKPDFFVPFIKTFIKNVDIENKVIAINVIEGML